MHTNEHLTTRSRTRSINPTATWGKCSVRPELRTSSGDQTRSHSDASTLAGNCFSNVPQQCLLEVDHKNQLRSRQQTTTKREYVNHCKPNGSISLVMVSSLGQTGTLSCKLRFRATCHPTAAVPCPARHSR